MLLIRKINTNFTKEIPVYRWDQHLENHNSWEIIKEYDLVQVYACAPGLVTVKKQRMEREDGIKFVKENADHFFDPLPETSIDNSNQIFCMPKREAYVMEYEEDIKEPDPEMIDEFGNIKPKKSAVDLEFVKEISAGDWMTIGMVIVVVTVLFVVARALIERAAD